LRTIEIEQEDDGRWIASASWAPGVMKYGATMEDAIRSLSVLLDELKALAGTTISQIPNQVGWSPQFGHKPR
jgi:predicted RNase H-like HicB family nuclease